MKDSDSASASVFRNKPFVILVVAVSLAFATILWPFYAPVFWATVLAIMFARPYRSLLRVMRRRRSLAAFVTTLLIILIVILPSALIAALLMQEGLGLYGRIQSGELKFSLSVQQIMNALPPWASGLLDRFGLTSLSAVQERLSAGLTKGIQFVLSHALDVGQNTLEFIMNFFVMLYLLFFFLRDGGELALRVKKAIPLDDGLQRNLGSRFADVIRATIKGSIIVAMAQGALGGLIFWLLGIRAAVLWAVVMAFLSLLPAVGTALVWMPVAIYLLVTGSTWQGVLLIAYGVLVIGLVDNVLRPMLVGKGTRMPDYVVLISTLGGIAIMGVNGFIIGPVIAALFITVWDVVASSRAEPSIARPLE